MNVALTDILARLNRSSELIDALLSQTEADLAGQTWLADIGELAGPVAHELNNFLNVTLLHVSVLEADVPDHLRSDLAEIRQQGAKVTALVKQLQEYRRREQPLLRLVDLNSVVRETVEKLTAGQSDQGMVPVVLALAPQLPRVLGSIPDLKRLCTFLLRNAAAATAGKGSVTVRTEPATDKVLLSIEDFGPDMEPEQAAQLFEPCSVGQDGFNCLELAACKTLLRRLQGIIRIENRSEGGACFMVELKIGEK